MINFENCLLKILKFFKKTNANNKRSLKVFVNKILHLKPINNKKQVVKKTQRNSNTKVTHELMMSKKLKMKLRVIMIMMVMMMMMTADLMIMVMMIR